jgi:DNA processing protein
MTKSEAPEVQAKLLALTELSGIGDKRALSLVETAGGIDSVFEAPLELFSDLHYMDKSTYNALQNLDETVQQYIERITSASEDGILLLTPIDDEYPDELRRHHTPLTVFLKGNYNLLETDCLSFAGSRDASSRALEWTQEVSSTLAVEGYSIVSGGAFGVDAAAHEAALDAGGNTIIVSPSGHDNPYPAANAELFDRVEQNGLIISHRFPDEEPARGGFLYRNKTNSALSSGIVIAAAGKDGGSMAQYEAAIKQGKQVFVPAKTVGANPSDGLEQMRSSEQASIIESAGDLSSKHSFQRGQKTLDDW